jgi:SAM-dependent methyltransferase
LVNPQFQTDPRSETRYEYGPGFYRANASIAVRSAERIVPKLITAFPVRNVVDFGCGRGAWLSVWAKAGAAVTGVDGPFVDRRQLLIDPASFRDADLAGPVDLGVQSDLVQSLEFAEHLPATSAEEFVETLVAHGSKVLFSAAIPGQGGEHHINEQPLEYWRVIFRKRGYAAIDFLRPLILNDAAVERWYRYNIMLYVRDDMIAALPERLRSCRVEDGQGLLDYRPRPYRLQNALVRRLPAGTVDRISRIKWRLATTRSIGVRGRATSST